MNHYDSGDPETGCGLILLFSVSALCWFLAGVIFALGVLR